MTEYERVILIGHYLSFSVNNDIDPRLLKRGFTDEQIQQIREHMGENSAVGLNLKFTRDLKEFVHPQFDFIYNMYDAWKTHNVLPFRGSYTEQPNKIIEHFSTLDGLSHESEKKAHASAMRDANKKR